MHKYFFIKKLNIPFQMLFLLVASSIAIADIIKEDDYFTALCIGEQSTGFNWKNGNWIQTNFTGKKIIAKKLKINQPKSMEEIKDDGFCSLNLRKKEIKSDSGNFSYTYGCYNIRKHGEDLFKFDSKLCEEIWIKSGGKSKLVSIECGSSLFSDALNFIPNGWFHMSQNHSDLGDNPKDDRKGSLYVSVGKCSVL